MPSIARRLTVLGLLTLAGTLSVSSLGPQAAGRPATPQLAPGPQQVWTCPMHREVLEHEKGTCPICNMDLVPTIVEPAWTCPIHAIIMEESPGKCRICQRDLVATTVEVTWVCPRHPDVVEIAPGKCRIDGTELERTRSMRPHENHNPQHGGQFFMAPDNWHHVEGTYPEPGVLRVYLYDNYSKPLDARTLTGRAVLEESYDQTSRTTKELKAVPFVASPDGAYLEARIENGPLPAEIAAKLTVARGQPESRFDFVFVEHSREPDKIAPAVAVMPPGAPAAPFQPLAQLVIPQTPEATATEIRNRGDVVRQLVQRGAFTEIFLPALEAKELGLALNGRLEGLPESQRAEVTLAIKQLVRAAYLLDWYGDLGNRAQVEEAHALFAVAISRIGKAYGR